MGKRKALTRGCGRREKTDEIGTHEKIPIDDTIIAFGGGGHSRAKYLRKKGYFASMGEHCYMQPINYGMEPWLISFGDNVYVASGVRFFTHDYTASMFQYMDREHDYQTRMGRITVGSNVFIGGCSVILYDVNIGDRVIIGAGSLINRDIPSGCVAAGVPCKVIGRFEDYQNKIQTMSKMTGKGQ